MSRISDHARKLLHARLERLVCQIEMGAPDALIAREAVLVGAAGRLLDPEGHVRYELERERLVVCHAIGVCAEPGCESDAVADHDASRPHLGAMCAVHDRELSDMLDEARRFSGDPEPS